MLRITFRDTGYTSTESRPQRLVNAGRHIVTNPFYLSKKLRLDCFVEEGVGAFIVPFCSFIINLESPEPSRADFSEKPIPLRTVSCWKSGKRNPVWNGLMPA